MRRLSMFSLIVCTAFVCGAVFSSVFQMALPQQVNALPPKGDKTGPCQCGCEKTGQCLCPNCSVGCGFLPEPPSKKGE
jgi:hypothetical protein